MNPPPPARVSSLAVASFLLGLSSLVFLGATGLPALLLGLHSLRVINASDGRLRGRRLAVGGAVLGGFAVVAVLIGLAVVGFAYLAARSQQLECLNNLRQIGLASLKYENDHDKLFPPGTLPNPTLPPERRLSWLVALPPYMEQNRSAKSLQGLYEHIDRDQGWDADANAPAAVAPVVAYRCPAHPFDDPRATPGRTHYVGLAGVDPDAALLAAGDERAGVLGYDRPVRQEDVTAGLSRTLMATETTRDNGPWTAGGPTTVRGVDPGESSYIGPGRPFGGTHPNGMNVLWADGSADFMSAAASAGVFRTATRIHREEGE